MKKIIISLVLAVVAINANAQAVANPFPKTIVVNGSAAMEIVPDEIYVNVELREYQKKGNPKKELDAIKSQFLQTCKTVGIPDSAVSIATYAGRTNYMATKRQRRSDPEMMATISYQIKFNSNTLMDKLVDALDDEATVNFQIVSTSHSRMPEFRKQLKIEAIKAAKEKGIYLTQAIDEKLGEAITIREPDEYNVFARDNRMANGFVQSNITASNDGSITSQATDFKKMRLRYEVEILFALK